MADPTPAAAPGSTLHIHCPPSLAFDAGSKYTGGVLREGDEAIDGFTVALNHEGEVLDDLEALRVYCDRVTDAGATVWDRHFPGRDVRVVVEAHTRPRRGGALGRIPLKDYVIPLAVVTAVWTAFPGCLILPPQRAGGRHKPSQGGTGRLPDYYPPTLIRHGRPALWLPNEHPKGVRDHEQAAYVLAGLAELLARGEAA